MAGNINNHPILNDKLPRNITLNVNKLNNDENLDAKIPNFPPVSNEKINKKKAIIKVSVPSKTKKKKSKKRCSYLECRVKLKLTDTTCRCGYIFCSTHRYSESHSCNYDYKTQGRKQLEKDNPCCQFPKIDQL